MPGEQSAIPVRGWRRNAYFVGEDESCHGGLDPSEQTQLQLIIQKLLPFWSQ